ncbi:MAG: hypothetical protein LBM05_00550 [Endomicrobium sp.]|jgi:hypothetical protein|nr:hypothetical protein [Endomicrobium sp.]
MRKKVLTRGNTLECLIMNYKRKIEHGEIDILLSHVSEVDKLEFFKSYLLERHYLLLPDNETICGKYMIVEK